MMTMDCQSLSNGTEDSIADDQAILKDLMEHVCKSSATFKTQQIDDPEIDDEEKRRISEALLFDNPIHFLNRFGPFLEEKHLNFLASFQNNSNKDVLDFNIAQLKKNLEGDARKTMIRNRRFEALKRLERDGKYFSEEEMEKRDPLLYHQLVGQYQTENEKTARYKRANVDSIPTFSSFLIERAESDALKELREQQEEAEILDCVSSDDDNSMHSEKSVKISRWGADWDDEEAERKQKKKQKGRRKKPDVLSKEEKMLLLQEFRTCMFTKFMDGLDPDFEYSTVDTNPEYDCLQERSQDEEEKYFDEETCVSVLCTDTGVEDY